MTKNIIIGILAFGLIMETLMAYQMRRKAGQDYRNISLSPQIKVIDWPEELAPLILDDSTFTAKLWFKMKGPHKLEVGFSHSIEMVRSEVTYHVDPGMDYVYQGDPVDYFEYVQDGKLKMLYYQTKNQIDSLKSIQ